MLTSGPQPLSAGLHSSNEADKLSQWLCTINIVIMMLMMMMMMMMIVIIIIVIIMCIKTEANLAVHLKC